MIFNILVESNPTVIKHKYRDHLIWWELQCFILFCLNNNNNNNGRFYCHSDKDLQKSTVHWHKVINLFAYFSLLCLSSIQEPLHIWDRTLFMSLCKTPFQHKLFISPLFHTVGNLSFRKQWLKFFHLETFFCKL